MNLLRLLAFFLTILSSLSLQAQFSYKIFDIDSRPNVGSDPENFTIFKNKVYFFAGDSLTGRELRVCDDTSVSIVADIAPGSANGGVYDLRNQFNHIAVVNDTLYFCARVNPSEYSIFKYDGSNPPQPVYTYTGANTLPISNIIASGGKLYYINTLSVKPSLVEYNPATGQISTINIGNNDITHTTQLFALNNKIYFNGIFTGSTPYLKMLYYDQTNNGINAINNTANYDLNYATPLHNKFYFRDGVDPTVIYETDGVSDVKVISKDSAINSVLPTYHYNGSGFGVHSGKIYYSAIQNNIRGLYEYDPVSGHNTFNQHLYNDTFATAFISYRNKLYYYNVPHTIVQDYHNPARRLHDIDSTIQFYFCQHSSFITNNDKLYGLIALTEDPNNHQHEFVVFYDSTVSVPELNQQQQLQVTAYPNPVSQDLTLKVQTKHTQSLRIQLADIKGQIIYKTDNKLYSDGNHTLTIPMQNLTTATYIYYILDSDNRLLKSGSILKK